MEHLSVITGYKVPFITKPLSNLDFDHIVTRALIVEALNSMSKLICQIPIVSVTSRTIDVISKIAKFLGGEEG